MKSTSIYLGYQVANSKGNSGKLFGRHTLNKDKELWLIQRLHAFKPSLNILEKLPSVLKKKVKVGLHFRAAHVPCVALRGAVFSHLLSSRFWSINKRGRKLASGSLYERVCFECFVWARE